MLSDYIWLKRSSMKRKLAYKSFSGLNGGEKLVQFINDNDIQQSDILKISFEPYAQLFYYVME